MVRLVAVFWLALTASLAGVGAAGAWAKEPAAEPAQDGGAQTEGSAEANAIDETPPEGAPAEEAAAEETAPGPADFAGGNPESPIVVTVYGDSLAEGLWAAIYRKLQRERGWTIVQRARHSTGFARSNYYNWFDAVEESLVRDDPDLAIVAIGLNDMQAFSVDRRTNLAFGGDAWIDAYSEAVGTFAQRFEQAGVPLLWIGLPVMRPGDYADQIALINGIFETVVPHTAARFVPLHPLTVDENGEYSTYLPDEDGRSRLVRANDGVHFTTRGYDLLADHIFSEMLEALAAAAAAPETPVEPTSAELPAEAWPEPLLESLEPLAPLAPLEPTSVGAPAEAPPEAPPEMPVQSAGEGSPLEPVIEERMVGPHAGAGR